MHSNVEFKFLMPTLVSFSRNFDEAELTVACPDVGKHIVKL